MESPKEIIIEEKPEVLGIVETMLDAKEKTSNGRQKNIQERYKWRWRRSINHNKRSVKINNGGRK